MDVKRNNTISSGGIKGALLYMVALVIVNS
jgi:hypothetical protein